MFEIRDQEAAGDAVKRLAKELSGGESWPFRMVFHGSPFRLELAYQASRVSSTGVRYEYDIGGFTLMEQPNCCGALLSTRTWVHTDWQRMGMASEMMKLKLGIAEAFGYSVILATVRLDNEGELHILNKFGWKQISEFLNRRTGNKVGFFVKNI